MTADDSTTALDRPGCPTAARCSPADAAAAVAAGCFRCGRAPVHARTPGSTAADRAQASTARAPLFATANLFPLLQLEGAGDITRSPAGAARALWDQRLPAWPRWCC